MRKFFERMDELAGIGNHTAVVAWLERAAFAFLILMLATAPHSIAATQTAWITGMFIWVVRLFFLPRVQLRLGPLDWALWAFFLWSVVTSFLSYEPAVSLDRLRGTALFLIVYFVIYNLRNLRAVYFAVFILILSCMVNVVWTPVQRALGRGIAVHGVRADSPLAKATLMDGDALYEVNGKKVSDPDAAVAAIEQAEASEVKAYRLDYSVTVTVKRADLLQGTTAIDKLGAASWGRTHNWRSSGFYGHYTTYAEVLQLIASLVLGLLVAGFFSGRSVVSLESSTQRSRLAFAALLISFGGTCLALLLTATRASQLGLMASGLLIFLFGASRKWLITALTVGIPVAVIGLFILQQSRGAGDPNDLSAQYRQMIWRDGVRLWSESPRHLVVGVGMDSIQKHWREWKLFDNGWQPMGHFHSTPIQLLAERGLPALLLWLAVLAIYARTLWRGLRRSLSPGNADGTSTEFRGLPERGVLLGCLGGMLGFFTSGLVHYNLGDQEVAMVFFILMGFGLSLSKVSLESQ